MGSGTAAVELNFPGARQRLVHFHKRPPSGSTVVLTGWLTNHAGADRHVVEQGT